ncbi:MAG: helix-turn-helix transcriptional regulator [Clostridia bacterium]|nr:helix-turn-helix transcriptional regulator [Clostridia bacterium]
MSISTLKGDFDMQVLIAERLRALMKDENLTQVELAKRIGVKQNTISAWLLQKKEPCITSLWLLADYFETDIDYLVGRKDTP